jgi:hypothetical protein
LEQGHRRKQAHDEHHDWIGIRRGRCVDCGKTFTFLPLLSLLTRITACWRAARHCSCALRDIVRGKSRSCWRDFTGEDDANAPKVAIINKRMAHDIFGDTSPIGRRLSIPRWAGDKSGY